MAKKNLKAIDKSSSVKDFKKLAPILSQINEFEKVFEKLSKEELSQKTEYFKQQLKAGKNLSDILPEAFAAVREASKRTLGLRHYDVQLIGGIVMHEGKIAEMRTGEGKTLVATLPLYLNALTGKGVHLVTVNDYLARRDARWMAPVYSALGLSIGVLQMASRTENGRMAFLVDLDKRSGKEDEDQLKMVPRREAYQADITYGTNNEFGFDYLRDNLVSRIEDRVQRGHNYAIVDEIDNILIDEARTPLIISGSASEDIAWYEKMARVVRLLNEEDYEFSEKDHSVSLTEVGEVHAEELLNTTLRDPDRPEDITPEQARLLGHLEQALKARLLFAKNKDYIVQNGEIIIVDEFTGRLMPGRRWSEGLHQAIEAKEGVRVNAENITQATITLQNYFRMYEKLAGMTGTAYTEAEEFYTIYGLDVVPIPTNLDYSAGQPTTELNIYQKKDGEGYVYTYYSYKNDPDRKEIFWKRKDYPDIVYQNREAKLRAICLEIARFNAIGRPQLVGTTSIVHSEELSARLRRDPIRLLMQVLLLKALWREKFQIRDIEKAIPELEMLNDSLDKLSPSLLRNLAQKAGIESIAPENQENIKILVDILNLSEQNIPRLQNILNAGIQHKVLNALKHDEESQIIAGAGAFGAVTIATNMAGRGVDIKLGGELDDQILTEVVQVLKANGIDPYDMTYKDMENAIRELTPEQYLDQEKSVRAFLEFMINLRKVREIGGLHVIGSERHEARRIDNQLRGRAARQGDPGSSRFYLSLEDDLMRLFGGDRVENLMSFFKLDKSVPIENRMIGRLVEQAQERVEGYNFDVRKHLLEYDDVLNDQRTRIYGERDKAITKEDLSEDIWGMVQSELQRRVPASLDESQSPWKLCAFLDEIQPAMINQEQNLSLPSYSFHLISNHLQEKLENLHNEEEKAEFLKRFAAEVIQAEAAYVESNIAEFIEHTSLNYETQVAERFDSLDAFLDGFVESSTEEFDEKEFRQQVQNYAHTRLQITREDIDRLINGDRGAIKTLKEQVKAGLFSTYLNRTAFTINKRIGDTINLEQFQVSTGDWPKVKDFYLTEIKRLFNQKSDALHTDQSEIARNIHVAVKNLDSNPLTAQQISTALFSITAGKRVAINPQNHQRVIKNINLLNYVFYAANLLEGRKPGEIIQDILTHLQNISNSLQQIFGTFEVNRLAQSEVTIQQLNPTLVGKIQAAIPPQSFDQVVHQPIHDLSPEYQTILKSVLGKEIQNMLHRHVLLNNINNLWIEHLTQMEALRVSIGLESYAQRDPLVQYKNRSTDMFSELLANIRLGVMSQIFRLQPVQRNTGTQVTPEQKQNTNQDSGKSKKHRRRR
jgi:preprotein translocase subunit SecA